MTPGNNAEDIPRLRCAIYTRKSTEEGLAQPFNSLDAQRESAEAYIRSQQSQGWVLLPERYDDGGFTGANMERPALRRLLADVAARRVDCVVVYKVDRLSRSLLDFARMMETFERHAATFVSVTQQFNTATSLGRLTLNILLSFAQFERDIIGERTRDKQAAARRKGKWTGGCLVLGYDLDPSAARLHINEEEAQQVRRIFDLFPERGALGPTLAEMVRRGCTNKSWLTRAGNLHQGGPFREESLRRLLTNPLYIGLVRQGGQDYPGEHEAIVERNSWDRVQQLLPSAALRRESKVANVAGTGMTRKLCCACCGGLMRAVRTRRRPEPYRYYVCPAGGTHRTSRACVCTSLPADELDGIVSGCIHSERDAEMTITDAVERAVWRPERGELTIHLYHGQERVLSIKRVRTSWGRIVLRTGHDQEGQPGPQTLSVAGPIPRISRLVALALRLDELLQRGEIENVAEVARLGNVTTARVRQILNLLDLAPDIQEQLLFLPAANRGCAAVTERELRRITTEIDWGRQRRLFAELIAARAVRNRQVPSRVPQ